MKRQKISLTTFLLVFTVVGAQDWSEPKFFKPPSGPGNVEFDYVQGEGRVSFDEDVSDIITIAQINYQGITEPTYTSSDDCDSNLGLSFKSDGNWSIQVKKKQDFETIKFYNCDIYIENSKGSIQISINDINDNPPILTSDNKICNVEENWNGITNCTMQLQDVDTVCPETNYIITESGAQNELFSIEISPIRDCNFLFTLTVNENLDYETKSIYMLTITALDGPLKGSTVLVVNIEDKPDMPPIWEMGSPIFNIQEETSYELQLKARDGDLGLNETIKFCITPDDDQKDYFKLNDTTGIITVQPIDRDILQKNTITVPAIAQDSVNESYYELTFYIEDINDNPPTIGPFNTTLVLYEGTTKTFSGINIRDPDQGENGTFNVLLKEENPGNNFTSAIKVIPDTGYQNGSFSIAVIDPTHLDFEDETWRTFSFQFVVIERVDNPHKISCSVTVKLRDVNDELPIFTDMETIPVWENVADGELITTLVATDNDNGDNLTYFTTSSSVKVDAKYGHVTAVGGEFDYERMKEMIIQVWVTDAVNHRDDANLHISIQDVNDTPPTISLASARINVFENASSGSIITDKIKVRDPDTDADLHFRINWAGSSATKDGVQVKKEAFNTSFEMDEDCNCDKEDYTACSCLMLAENVSWSVMDTVSLEVIVKDNNTLVNDAETNAMIVILIQDVNDHAPVFEPIPLLSIKELSPTDEKIDHVKANDEDGPGYNNVNYSLIEIKGTPSNLVKIDSHGLLSADKNKGIVCKKGRQELYYTVTATDGENSTPQDITIKIEDTNNELPRILNDFPIPNITIKEGMPSGTYVHKVNATDDDVQEEYSTVNFLINKLNTGVKPNISSYFAINFTTGEITVQLENENITLNREETAEFTIPIIAQDNYNDPDHSNKVSTVVIVTLEDINDNPPVFPEDDGCLASPLESAIKGDFIHDIVATDADEKPEYKNITYELMEITTVENPSLPLQGLFDLKQADNKAKIYAGRNLTGYVGQYHIKIQGMNPDEEQASNGTVTICIQDVNDNSPQITYPTNEDIILIEDSQEIEKTIMTYNNGTLPPFSATDADYGDNAMIDFQIIGSDIATYYFHMINGDGKSVELRLQKSLDINSDRKFQMTIQASDRGTPSKLTNRVDVTICVLTKGHDPTFNVTSVDHKFLENITATSQSFIIPPANDIDNLYRPPGMEDKIYYFIVEGNDKSLFQLDMNTRELSVDKVLDYETEKEHILMIVAKNKISDPNGTNKLKLIIEVRTIPAIFIPVQDVNDCAPEFQKDLYIGGIAPGDNPRAQVLKFNVTDGDENDAVTYSLLWDTMQANDSLQPHAKDAFKLENEVLLLNFSPDNTMSGYFSFKVSATDKVGHTATVDVLVVMISAINRESFLFENHKDYVDNHTEIIEEVLTDSLQYFCTVEFTAVDNTQEVTEHTSVTTHFIDQETNLPVENTVIDLLITEKTTDLKPEFRKYGLKWIDVGRQDEIPTDQSGLRQTVLIAVCAILATLVLLLLAAFFVKTRRLNQRLEALSQTRFGSQDSGLNRVNMNVPNTNQHALEGSNPVWNEELTNDDNISQGSGDSELVGVEDNPEFRPQDNYTEDSRRGSKNPYFENIGNAGPSTDYPEEQDSNEPNPNFSFGPPQPSTPTTEL